MAKTQKGITLQFTPKDIQRGEWGKAGSFYLSTFRFPIEEARKLERRSKALGLTMSSLVNQLVMCFNKTVGEPKGVKTEKTTHPTIWGADNKKAFFKKKGLKVPVKRSDAKAATKVEKKKAKKVVAKKPTKVVKTTKVKAAKKVEKKGGAAAVLARLRAMREAA